MGRIRRIKESTEKMTDIIIIAASRNNKLIAMTQKAINSCYESIGDFNIVVIETFKRHKYRNAQVIEFKEEKFNYNKTINFAIGQTSSYIIGVFNNDIEFDKDWYVELQKGFDKYDSLSPRCVHSNALTQKQFVEGYKLRKSLNGWAIVFKRRPVLRKIGKFNEDVEFWRSDDIYGEQLKVNGIKHALVTNSIVNHLESKTLNQSKNKDELTKNQFGKFKDIDVSKHTFSIIMPVYLGEYSGAAKNREHKFKRAIDSVLNQTYQNFELIIVSDGCDKAVDIYQDNYSQHKNIRCLKIPKQAHMSGTVRTVGIDKAVGKYIAYLDSDDMFTPDHLGWLKFKMQKNDWVYFNDIYYNGKDNSVKKVNLSYGVAGTSSICHKRLLKEDWNHCDGYGHDWKFIQKLMRHNNNKHVGTGGYLICHTPTQFDYDGQYC